MINLARYLLQLAAFTGFALLIGYFSRTPSFDYAPAGAAIVKMSFNHAADRVVPCVLLTPEQIAALAPNMRRAQSCERQRLPLSVELDVDGKSVLSMQAKPSGLWGDGPASVYRKIEMQPGRYLMELRLRDTARSDGWDYTHAEEVDLVAGRYLTITFRAETGGFKIR